MMLDSSTLTVKLVVDDPRGLGLGGVKTALSSRANWRRALGQTGDVAGEHDGRRSVVLKGRGTGRRMLKSKPLQWIPVIPRLM